VAGFILYNNLTNCLIR